MVAYNFHPRFASQIELGFKLQTIRRDRAVFGRHARVGDQLQLYTGQRTGRCRLIRDDVVCTAVLPCAITFGPAGRITRIAVGDVPVRSLSDFVQRDGFDDVTDMSRFFADAYADGRFQGEFVGVLIEWAIRLSA